MPILIPRTHIVELNAPRKFLVRDDFTDNLAAGAVDGTSPTPGPGGARVVVDTGSVLSTTGGQCVISGATGIGDPGFWYGQQTRKAGVGFLAAIDIGAARPYCGWFAGQDAVAAGAFHFYPGDSLRLHLAAGLIEVGAWTVDTDYQIAIIMRAAGLFHLVNGGAYSGWTLLWVDSAETDNPYPGYANRNSTDAAVDALRVAQLGSPWSDTYAIALAYATFTDSNDTAIADYTPEVGGAWIADVGTWQIQTNAAQSTALAGGIAIATVDAGVINVLQTASPSVAGGVAGVIVRYADADNYVRAVHNGTNATLTKVVAGVPTDMIDAAAAYRAGREIRIICDGTAFDMFYHNVKIGTTQTIADAGLQTGTKVGLYSTNTGNTFDAADCYPRDIIGSARAELEKYTR